MLKVTLGERDYTVDYVRAIALREIGQPLAILKRLDGQEAPPDFGKDLDALVKWFCLVFGNQFTVEDVYNNYPADRLLTDLFFAVTVVRERVTAAVIAFPTTAGGTTKQTESP
ncbi:MAG: hypothetical protein J5556_06975 [Deltaproteobacteria bacterium]|nr:hypothetical protein [Deltaproteobacteria bacterium]